MKDTLEEIATLLEEDEDIISDLVYDAAGQLSQLWEEEPLDCDAVSLISRLFETYLNELNGNTDY